MKRLTSMLLSIMLIVNMIPVTAFATDEVNGEHIEVSVLFVHAQDHLMTAMEVRSLAERFIHINKKVNQLLERE